MKEENNAPQLERLEEIINWTLPGLTQYYRDTQLSQDVIDKYEYGRIIRSQIFNDVSSFAGRPITNCRFIINSSKAAPLYEITPNTEKWRLHMINCNSYFKILDVYKYENVTQILLLHIPLKGVEIFQTTMLKIGEIHLEKKLIDSARDSLHQKMKMETPPALQEKEWLERTSIPIGLDPKNNFFSLEPMTNLDHPMISATYSGIRKLTNDLSDLNHPSNPENTPKKPSFPTEEKSIKKAQPIKKKGFWSRLFGGN